MTPALRRLLAEARKCAVCKEPWECGDCHRPVSGLLGWCPGKKCAGRRIAYGARGLLEKHLEHLLAGVRE